MEMSPDKMKAMWNDRYGKDGFAYGTAPNDFLVEVADHLDGDILCVAEGEGRNAVFLAERNNKVLAVDQSITGLDKASKLAKERGVAIEVEEADLADYDLGQRRFDGIVSIFAHLPPPLRARLHQSVVNALRPGGVFVLEAYTPKQLEHKTGGPPVLALLAGVDELKRELDGLTFEIAREVEREIDEGEYHHGLSATVQILARKP